MKLIVFLFIYLSAFSSCFAYQNFETMNEDTIHYNNKVIPKVIEEEAKIAIDHFSDLHDVPIEIRFKGLKKSFMNAQPRVADFLKSKKKRSYIISISSKFIIENEKFSIDEIPSEVMIGWIGHELGHIMDYQHRSAFNLIGFGIGYWTSKNYIRKAERRADTYAVKNGMGEYIIATKNFILNHTELPEDYKENIKQLYLSPDEILMLIDEDANIQP